MWILRIQTFILAPLETRRPILENTLKPKRRHRLLSKAIISIVEFVLNAFQRSFFFLFPDNTFSASTIVVLMFCALLVIVLLACWIYFKYWKLWTDFKRRSERKTEKDDVGSHLFTGITVDSSSTVEENKKNLRQRKINHKKIEEFPVLPSALVNGALLHNLFILSLGSANSFFSLHLNLTF